MIPLTEEANQELTLVVRERADARTLLEYKIELSWAAMLAGSGPHSIPVQRQSQENYARQIAQLFKSGNLCNPWIGKGIKRIPSPRLLARKR